MKEVALDTLINLVHLTSGRRIHALRKVREVAKQFGHFDLVQRIDGALANDRETRALDNRWDGNKHTPTYGPEVPEIDNWVDQLLTSIRDTAAFYTRGAFKGVDLEAQAERFLEAAFPAGVQAITSLSYVDQVAAVEVMLDDLRGKLASEVETLGLSHLVERLGELTARYREAVDKGREQLEYATVQAARKRGQRNLLEIVAMVIGMYYSHTDPDHVARRAALLAPILDQDRRVRAIISARRGVPDIDPDAPPDDAAPDDAAPSAAPAEPDDAAPSAAPAAPDDAAPSAAPAAPDDAADGAAGAADDD